MFRKLSARVTLICNIQNCIQAFIIRNTFFGKQNQKNLKFNNFVKLLPLIYQFISLIKSKPNLVCTSIEMLMKVQKERENY